MGKRHKNKWINTYDDEQLDLDIRSEAKRGIDKFGECRNMHELYAVLLEEVEEFWDSVKEDDPDPNELLQVCAIARRGILILASNARDDINRQKTNDF